MMNWELTFDTARDDFTANAEAAMLAWLDEHDAHGGPAAEALIVHIEAASLLFGRGLWWQESGSDGVLHCTLSGDDSQVSTVITR